MFTRCLAAGDRVKIISIVGMIIDRYDGVAATFTSLRFT
jgi:hypothetical protein